MDENNEVIREEGQMKNDTAGKKNNGLALASFIMGIVCFIIAGIPLGTAAVITGIVAITKFDSETEKNKWMAYVGIVLGAIGAILAVILIPTMLNMLNLQ